MKKVIVILSLFAVMMLAAVGELVYTTHFYNNQLSKLNALSQSMYANTKQLNNDNTVQLAEDCFAYWEKGKPIIMMLNNHSSIKNADEKMVSLIHLVKMNQEYDAIVSLEQTVHFITGLKKDHYPDMTNLF